MWLCVQHENGQMFDFNVEETVKIRDLKIKVQEACTKYKLEDQSMIYAGKFLKDEQRISSINLEKDCPILLVCRPSEVTAEPPLKKKKIKEVAEEEDWTSWFRKDPIKRNVSKFNSLFEMMVYDTDQPVNNELTLDAFMQWVWEANIFEIHALYPDFVIKKFKLAAGNRKSINLGQLNRLVKSLSAFAQVNKRILFILMESLELREFEKDKFNN